MRKFIVFLSFLSFLFGLDSYDVKNWYDAGSYNRVCQDSVREYFILNQDPAIANMYANSCLQMDKINELIIPVVMLYETKEARVNASLYATILFQKKMLYLALVDGVDISYIRTPKVEYILSIVFDKFVAKEYEVVGDAYRIKLTENSYSDLLVNEENGITQMIIAIYEDGRLRSVKKYW
ncbi:MAG: hypothetical protein GX282_07215 [Campylobacteraceae bacterium]|nr:hypothetical protein [Campylobacteraceae bacterium]